MLTFSKIGIFQFSEYDLGKIKFNKKYSNVPTKIHNWQTTGFQILSSNFGTLNLKGGQPAVNWPARYSQPQGGPLKFDILENKIIKPATTLVTFVPNPNQSSTGFFSPKVADQPPSATIVNTLHHLTCVS